MFAAPPDFAIMIP